MTPSPTGRTAASPTRPFSRTMLALAVLALPSLGATQELPEGPVPPSAIARVLRDFQRTLGTPLLVAAVGPDTTRVLDSALRPLRELPLERAQVPLLGTPEEEMQRVLAASAIPCGVRVEARGRKYLLQAWGDCTAESGPRGEEEFLEEELLEAEVLQDDYAVKAGEETFGSPLDEYRVRRLTRVHLGAPSHALYGARWTIQDGQGRMVSTASFARLTGDVITRSHLVSERKTARRRVILQVGVGAGLVGGAAWTLAHARDGYPSWNDYKPGSAWSYESDAEYQQAMDEARAAYQRDLQDVPRDIREQGEARLWAGVFLGAAGVATLATVPLVTPGVEARQQVPALYYSPARAQTLIDVYNAALRTNLGLDGPTGPRSSAPPSPSRDVEILATVGPDGVRVDVRF